MIDVALIIGVVVALTQLAKTFVSNKYLPLISLVLGLIGGYFYIDAVIQERILYGLMVGLSASGLFDQSKIVTKKGVK
ncbi:holin [Bacillus sp. V3B]|uniref:holin n=1 Tax=Bacillus sp. V3B TaxID=2804915 RepID=UPI00210A1F6C|nr:holin [Bacillus sp. V3B]MCQ6275743.1 holin [Bacillus sp. V3B]